MAGALDSMIFARAFRGGMQSLEPVNTSMRRTTAEALDNERNSIVYGTFLISPGWRPSHATGTDFLKPENDMETLPHEPCAGDGGPPPVRRSSAFVPSSPRMAKRPRILVYIDDSERAGPIAANAIEIARSLGLDVTFARIIELGKNATRPMDPIAWQLDLQRHEAILDSFARRVCEHTKASRVVLVGDPPTEIIDWAEENGAGLMALATRTSRDPYAMDPTALRVLQSGATSLLLLPPQAVAKASRFRRILVPIDGSPRAESVLPVALRIARTNGADLLLAHVVPRSGTSHGFRAERLKPLRAEIDRQNYKNAKADLEQLRLRVEEEGIDVQVRLLGPDDPRHATCRLASEASVDLVVMSSHGATALNDVPCGSVAEYLATHCTMPVMIVRPDLLTDFGSRSSDTNGQSVFQFD